MADLSHPSLDDLADLHEGTLDEQRSSELRPHVGSCAACSAAMSALDEVQAVLAAEGASSPVLPSSVAEALGDALNRARLERSAGVVSLDARRSADRDSGSGHRRGAWLRAAAAAAAVVVVVGGGVELARETGSGSRSADQGGAVNAGASAAQRDLSEAGGAGGGAGPGADVRTGDAPTAAPLGGRAATVTPRTLPRFAKRLSTGSSSSHHLLQQRLEPCRAPKAVRSRGIVADIVWKGRPAVVVIDRADHRATVYACAPARSALYSSPY